MAKGDSTVPNPFNVVLLIILGLFVVAIGSVVIGEGSVIGANVAMYIMDQFQ
jgi:hypothetical protein